MPFSTLFQLYCSSQCTYSCFHGVSYTCILHSCFPTLTLSQTSPGFYESFENTVGKGEIACNKQFLLFPQCFLSFWKTFCHFHQIQNCRLQTLSVWMSLNFVIWERVNDKPITETMVCGKKRINHTAEKRK